MDDQLKEAELQRIQAETEKYRAEKLKIDRELKWHSPRSILKIIIAVLIFLPMIWFYFEKVAIPAMQADNIRLNRENQKALTELEKREKIFQAESTKFQFDRKRFQEDSTKLEKDKSILQHRNVKYQADLLKLNNSKDLILKEYKELSTSANLTQKERNEYLTRLQEMEGERLSEAGRLKMREHFILPRYLISPPQPNPFTNTTKVSYEIPEVAMVTALIYDSSHSKVKKVFYIDTSRNQGSYDIVWDGRDDAGNILPSGKYFCRIRLGNILDEEVEIIFNRKQ